MNEFEIIKKYFKPLSSKNLGSLNLNDDIFYDSSKKMALSIDTYVEGIHFIGNDPKFFLKKILRSSLSDLYAKGVKPKVYFLSLALNKKIKNQVFFKKIKTILNSEQNKFKISLGGGDTINSSKIVITIVVTGSVTNKPVLRSGCSVNDDIYVTGNIGDSFLGLNIIKKRYSFGNYNKFYKKIFYEPNLPYKFSPYLSKVASSSIDISDGLGQDLSHICKLSNLGAYIDLNLLPISIFSKNLIKKKQVKLENFFSKGDDYQILFTAKPKYRSKINYLSKKTKVKISRIGFIKKQKKIIFKYNKKELYLTDKKMGYIHKF